MDNEKKEEILFKAGIWFKEEIVKRHYASIERMSNLKKVNINPFTISYLSQLLKGQIDTDGIARAIAYPSALGARISTIFGNQIQSFVSTVLDCAGSGIDGIDIEFDDCIDHIHKYCQMKAGPTTINKDDVKTISDHFTGLKRRFKTNNVTISNKQLVVGVVYGDTKSLAQHYKNIETKYCYDVFVGCDFWRRLTGDKNFYFELIKSVNEVSKTIAANNKLEDAIQKIAKSSNLIDELKHLS